MADSRRRLKQADYARIGLPRKYWAATVGDLTGSQKKTGKAMLSAYQKDRSIGFIIQGERGRGKTHLLCAIGSEIRALGNTVLFVPFDDVSGALYREGFDGELDTVLSRMKSVDVLMIDDYDTATVEKTKILYSVIRHRVENGVSTIITLFPLSESNRREDSADLDNVLAKLSGVSINFKLGGVDRWEDAKKRLLE